MERDKVKKMLIDLWSGLTINAGVPLSTTYKWLLESREQLLILLAVQFNHELELYNVNKVMTKSDE